MKKILITGVCGFIGYHTALELGKDYEIIGVDNLNSYYSPDLKLSRLFQLRKQFNDEFTFYKLNINNKQEMIDIFKEHKIDIVIHLAAQAGVRYSFENPSTYIENNIDAFATMLEIAKMFNVEKVVWASSSSVYGNEKLHPYTEDMSLNSIQSLYGLTKKIDEDIANFYNKQFDMNIVGLRFFTVYGEYGRPDMAYYKFLDKFFNDEPIEVYNEGKLFRDFTYVKDIVIGIRKVVESSHLPRNIYNIGYGNPVSLRSFIEVLEDEVSKQLGKRIEFKLKYLPMQKGDVMHTHASTEALENDTGYRPVVRINEGLKHFVTWYLKYHTKRRK